MAIVARNGQEVLRPALLRGSPQSVVTALAAMALLPPATYAGAGYKSCKPVYDLLYPTDDLSDAQKIRSKGADCGEARMLVAAE